MNLMAKKLYPSDIVKISAVEYRHLALADAKLDRMRRFKDSMLPPPIEIPQKNNTAKIIWGTVILSLSLLLLLLLLLQAFS